MVRRSLAYGVGVLALLGVGGGIGVTAQGQSSPNGSAMSPERALITQYCGGCHNSRAQAGGLSLDGADPSRVGEHREIWEKVVRKLRARAMPPAGSRRPDEPGYERLVAQIESALDREAALHPDPGRTDTFRRLTRT